MKSSIAVCVGSVRKIADNILFYECVFYVSVFDIKWTCVRGMKFQWLLSGCIFVSDYGLHCEHFDFFRRKSTEIIHTAK